jgi:hypothetical protein
MQVHRVIGYRFFLSYFVTNQSIGPGNRLLLDLVIRFARHFCFEAFDLLFRAASQKLVEVSDAARPN